MAEKNRSSGTVAGWAATTQPDRIRHAIPCFFLLEPLNLLDALSAVSEQAAVAGYEQSLKGYDEGFWLKVKAAEKYLHFHDSFAQKEKMQSTTVILQLFELNSHQISRSILFV